MSAVVLLCRIAVGGLLGFAAFHKIQDPQEFAFAINAYKILPDHLVHVSAFAIPWTEALAAVALVLGFWTRGAAIVASVLLLSFLAAIISLEVRGVTVSDCSCFGDAVAFCPKDEPPGACHILQDAILLILSGVVVFWGGGAISLDRLLAKRPHEAPRLINVEEQDGRPL